ncbi:MAG: FAD:protein FMN transferase, partial [Actinobacteria bacterium]|nr:FAD:protein FMN transferase [Actinomycetota bacterium]
AHLVLWGTPADAAWAQAEIERLEARWSRFLPDSDVTRCNRASGHGPVEVAPETVDLVAAAIAWWHRTDGRFDPTVLHALEALGYDAPFAEVRARRVDRPVVRSAPPGHPELRIPAVSTAPDLRPAPGCAGIVVDRAAATIALPAGVGLDLGGIGKGAAADRVADGLRARGVTSACIGMGGDIRAFGPGNGPAGQGWAITVDDPLDPSRAWFTHVIDDAAVVTSTDRIRRWERAGRAVHHLVDPTTGSSARTGLAAVVVAAPSCADAEVLAKAAFVAGPDAGRALCDRFGVETWFAADTPTAVGSPT